MIDPTTDYALDVVTGKLNVCKYVRLACQRHIDDLSRTDIWFDDKAAERFFRYTSHVRHYKGPYRGKPIDLEDWQKFVFGNIYGWKTVVDGVKTDTWRFNYAYLEVPRKNGKTTIAAAGASYDARFMEATGAEVYCLATKEDQAKILVNDVMAFIRGSTDLQQEFEIMSGRHTVFARPSGRTSFIKPLGSDSKTLDGLNPFAVYADELHEWPARELWDVMEDAFGARTNWHMIAITTAGSDKNGICYTERDHLIETLEGRITADNKFGVIYTIDTEDKDRWMEEDVWWKANPNLGKGKELNYVRGMCAKALQMPSKLAAFLNKQLNLWTDVTEIWITDELWKSAQTDFYWSDLKGLWCYAGIDLAKVNDLSAVSYFFPPQPGCTKGRVIVEHYIPEATARERQIHERLPYDVWARQGWVKLTPGNTTDYSFIRRDMNLVAKTVNIKEVGFDRHFGGIMVNDLQDDGFVMIEHGMGFVSMNPPCCEFERMLIAKEIETNRNPLLATSVAAAVIVRDAANNMKPDKAASKKRIDGVTATVIAVGLHVAKVAPKKRSPYEDSGLKTL